MISGMAGFTKEECPQCVISQGEDFASYVLPSQSTCTKESCEEYCKSNEPPNTKLWMLLSHQVNKNPNTLR
nr:hypothetical protein [Tanacetum cinerariifolium]